MNEGLALARGGRSRCQLAGRPVGPRMARKRRRRPEVGRLYSWTRENFLVARSRSRPSGKGRISAAFPSDMKTMRLPSGDQIGLLSKADRKVNRVLPGQGRVVEPEVGTPGLDIEEHGRRPVASGEICGLAPKTGSPGLPACLPSRRTR